MSKVEVTKFASLVCKYGPHKEKYKSILRSHAIFRPLLAMVVDILTKSDESGATDVAVSCTIGPTDGVARAHPHPFTRTANGQTSSMHVFTSIHRVNKLTLRYLILGHPKYCTFPHFPMH